MGLLDQVAGVLGKYSDPAMQQHAPGKVENDFEQTSRESSPCASLK